MTKLLQSDVTIESIHPPGPVTNYTHPQCYLSITNDCSTKLTREHIVSSAVLREIDIVIALEGLPWLQPRQKKHLRISAINSKVLCDRHNTALSKLDKIGTKFFKALKQFTIASYNGKERLVIVSGRDLERWMLKILYGLLASNSLQQDYGNPIRCNVDQRCIDLLYEKVPFEQGRGLFVRTDYPGPMPAQRRLRIRPLLKVAEQKLKGIELNILGFDFLLSTCPINVEGGIFRPGFFLFSSHTGTKVIRLTWPDPGPQLVVRITNSQR